MSNKLKIKAIENMIILDQIKKFNKSIMYIVIRTNENTATMYLGIDKVYRLISEFINLMMSSMQTISNKRTEYKIEKIQPKSKGVNLRYLIL